jgi:protein gp37
MAGFVKDIITFVNSMSDLFHEDVAWSLIEQVFDTMQAAPQHTFQVLTKRAENMRRFAEYWAFHHSEPLPNVWLGVSVEDQPRADERIPLLLQTPAAVRFISAEPLLGPVDLDPWLYRVRVRPGLACRAYRGEPNEEIVPRLDWVIVGGESGPGARPTQVQWARSIVQQCAAARVPVFVKQLGAHPHGDDGSDRPNVGNLLHLRDRKGGDMAEWPADLRVREFPR